MAPPKKKKSPGPQVVNRQARFQYEIHETFEAGIVLKGTEVKSIRSNHASLQEAYVRYEENELWLLGCNIDPYAHGNIHNHEPRRRRKLLLHKKEIAKIQKRVNEKGWTIIPLNFHLKNGKIKVDIALGTGKKLHDKRATVKERDTKREMDRTMKGMRG